MERRGRHVKLVFHFPWKCWKITDTSSWQVLISTLCGQTADGKTKTQKKDTGWHRCCVINWDVYSRRNQLVPVVKMSLCCMCTKRWPQHRRLLSQVSIHNIGHAFQITKTKPEGGDPNYIKFVTTSLAQTQLELRSLYSNNVIWEFKQTVEGQHAYGFI